MKGANSTEGGEGGMPDGPTTLGDGIILSASLHF